MKTEAHIKIFLKVTNLRYFKTFKFSLKFCITFYRKLQSRFKKGESTDIFYKKCRSQ